MKSRSEEMLGIGKNSLEEREIQKIQKETWNKYKNHTRSELKKAAKNIQKKYKNKVDNIINGRASQDEKFSVQKAYVKTKTIMSIYQTIEGVENPNLDSWGRTFG
jgi:ClpP class serine protease